MVIRKAVKKPEAITVDLVFVVPDYFSVITRLKRIVLVVVTEGQQLTETFFLDLGARSHFLQASHK